MRSEKLDVHATPWGGEREGRRVSRFSFPASYYSYVSSVVGWRPNLGAGG